MNSGQNRLPAVGIIGGGQLARMMIYRTRKWGLDFSVLESSPDCPAGTLADWFVQGSLQSSGAIRELAASCDVMTYDIEHINTNTLLELEDEGVPVFPSPRILQLIQDKGKQKAAFRDKGIPVPDFFLEDTPLSPKNGKLTPPFVQKLRRGGYDGRGVIVVQDERGMNEIADAPSIIEDYIDREKELAVMVVRDREGNIVSYPVTEMFFDPETQICTRVEAPAGISPKTAAAAVEIAAETVRILDSPGIYGVEMFLTRDGSILVNEVAPRPHNSGHYTMEGCVTCQFEQHIRAICGYPLGSAELLAPSVMINVLGSRGYSGSPVVHGLREIMSEPQCSLHLYGKKETRPNRKMGHFTVTDRSLETARETAYKMMGRFRIEGKEKNL